MAKIGFEPLKTLEIVEHADLDERDFDERGNYKFPNAVAPTEAWRFVPQPLLEAKRSGYERVQCSEVDLASAWASALVDET